MPKALVLVSGFGPFESVANNASGALARALGEDPPEGVEVLSACLPTSFWRAPRAWDALLARSARSGRGPDAVLALGVHSRAGYRLELRARARLDGIRQDVDGWTARASTHAGSDLATPFDLDDLARSLSEAGAAPVWISQEAGGYVCERLYHHVLSRGRARGVPTLFLHVPPVAAEPILAQARAVGALLRKIAGAVAPSLQEAG